MRQSWNFGKKLTENWFQTWASHVVVFFLLVFNLFHFFFVKKSEGQSPGVCRNFLSPCASPSSNLCRLILLQISIDFSWFPKHIKCYTRRNSSWHLKEDSINERTHVWIFTKCQIFLTTIIDKYNTKYWDDCNITSHPFLWILSQPPLWPPSQQSKKKIFHFLAVASFEILRS